MSDNPWGDFPKNKKQEDVLQDVQDKIKDLFSKASKNSGGNGGNGKEPFDNRPPAGPLQKYFLLVLFLVALVGITIWKSLFVIEPGEQGVVLRLGAYDRTVGPGLNYIMPYVEEIFIVNVEKIRKEEFGFRTTGFSGGLGKSVTNNMEEESLMLTGDRNVINVNWVVQYSIVNPLDFLFRVKDVDLTVKEISETVLRRLVGNRDFDYVLNNRDELAIETRLEMQEMLDRYESGISLLTVQLQDVTPPGAVRPSFNEVNEADQDRTRLVNEAQKEYNDKIPKARGEANRVITQAEGYRIDRVNRARGDAERFKSIYEEYRKFPEVTRRRIYLETITSVLPQVEEIYIMDNKSGVLPLLNIKNQGGIQ